MKSLHSINRNPWILGALACASFWACSAEETGSSSGGGGNGGEGGTTVTTTSEVTTPATTAPATTGTTTVTGTGGSGGGGGEDAGTSCADALPLTEAENTLGGTFYDASATLNDPTSDQDHDYFSVEVPAGSWIQISTDTTESGMGEGSPDTVVTVFNEDGSVQLAESDDQSPRIDTDSELFYRNDSSSAVTLCLHVQEWSTWADDAPLQGPNFGYRLVAVPMDFSLYDFYNLDTEELSTPLDNDDAASAQVLTGSLFGDVEEFMSTNISGVFNEGADEDWFTFTTGPGVGAVFIDLVPQDAGVYADNGSSGYGSTAPIAELRLFEDGEGVSHGALPDPIGNGLSEMNIAVKEDTTYHVQVVAPDGALGANPFYQLKFTTNNYVGIPEQDDNANDNSDGAQAASVHPNDPALFVGMGEMADGVDEDWWSFDAAAGKVVNVFCNARRQGSGVDALTVDIYEDPAGAALASGTETQTDDLALFEAEAATVSNTGTHYARVRSNGLLGDVQSGHYFCFFQVTDP